jgi:hypothetical protein
MSRFAFLAALTLGAWAFVSPAFAQAYFAEIDDLPMPAGFAQSAPAQTFETQEGFLILAEAEGRAPLLEVRDFYYETLPQLGWAVSPRDDGVLMFQRGRERLTFTLERAGASTHLGARLAVSTGPAGSD